MAPRPRLLELSQKNGERLSHPPPGEEVVISGMSGCFPQSDNIHEFRDNLLNKVDMVTAQDVEEHGASGLPKRSGKLKSKILSKFDATYFGIPSIEAEVIDPMSRMAMEKTYEAIVDAGVNPYDLRGKKVGVYVSTCISETERHVCYEILELQGFAVKGTERAGFANRISSWLQINGPSYVIDTACSSSLYAFNAAYEDLRDGIVEKAIVAGLNIILTTFLTRIFVRLGVVGLDGVCRVFDDEACGYVRGEAISVLFLEKAKDAKRIYASVLHSKSNCDGYKPQGITFPSSEVQQDLLKQVYSECHMDPALVDYVEAHGTGTEVGDPEELLAIDKVFCTGRKGPLLIGSLKSNIGHSEGAAGASSIVKSVLCMEMGKLVPNLHYNTPHKKVEGLRNGKFKVVTDVIPWEGTTAAINSFGFGGANCHLLLRSNQKKKIDGGRPKDNIPRLVVASGRTVEGVISILDDVESRPVDAEYVNLLQSVFSKNLPYHPYRGYTILAPGKRCRKTQFYSEERPPLWFVFSGLGSQWPAMGEALLEIPVFAETVRKCDSVLKPLGKDVTRIITEQNSHIFDNAVNCFVGITAIQVGLVDILTALGVVPDGIVGHSIGELVCAYADGCLTLEQTILAAYYCGLACDEALLPEGAVASINVGPNQIHHQLPKNIELVGADSADSCLIAGPAEELKTFAQNLYNVDGKEVKLLTSGNVPYHTRNMVKASPKVVGYLTKLIPNPKVRSGKWVSSSDENIKYSSAEYFANSLLNPVLFSKARSQIPDGAVLVEISPKNVVSDVNITLYENTEDGVLHLLNVLAQLYVAGFGMDLTKLYPAVPYPVSRGTPMISPHIKWQHNQEWFVYNKFTGIGGSSGHMEFLISLKEKEEHAFYAGHIIDGRNLFPATGYLFLVWQAFASMKRTLLSNVSFKCTDVKFSRATHLSKDASTIFTVMIQPVTGCFEVMESGTAIVTGFISTLTSPERTYTETLVMERSKEKDVVDFSSKDIYKELRLRGYQYTGLFRSLVKATQDNTYGEVRWHNNWVAFLDNLLQIKILSTDSRGLYVPTSIEEISVDVAAHEKIAEQLGEEPVIPICVNRQLNTIKSGGVQIRGIKASPITRRKPLGEPVLERYQFVPYHVTDSSAYNLRQALTLCVHMLLENYGVLKLDVAELVALESKPDTQLLCSILSAIIGDLPLMKAEMTLYGDPEDPHIKELEIPVTVEPGALTPDLKYHVIVASSVTGNKPVIQSILSSLHPEGCVIAREQPGLNVSGDHPGLDVVFDLVVENERFVMYKKKCENPDPVNNATIIHITEANFDWLPQLQAAIKQAEPHKRVLLVAQGEPMNGVLGLFNCLHREPGGDITRCVLILDKDAPPFDPVLPLYRTQLEKDLAVNILKDGQWGSYRHLLLDKLALVDVPHSFSNTAVYADLSSLAWFQGPIDPYSVKPSQDRELVHIYYSALNFRDVMLATGRLALDVAVPHRLSQDCTIGLEFSGRTSTGKRIMGTANKGAVASVILADPSLLWTVPEHWSLQDAATVPVVYGTVLYALCVSTKVKKGESILIHSGTGGIGLAAIYISLHYGLNIFTTVGTQEKRDFIRKTFPQIPEQNIGNSRDISFEQMVMRETGGRGVDLVLNSLAEEKLQASVRCLARGGRFLEIGKFDLAANNQIRMELFLKNISYHGIMLDLVYTGDASSKRQLQCLLQEAIDSGAVQPLRTCSVFGEDEVEQAFRFMASGKHIGKVLIKMRDEEPQKIVTPTVKITQAVPRFYCYPHLSYIIAGGLGGFGLELADWLVLRGARVLVLTSRRGITNGYQSSRVRIWRSYGVKVHISTEDISTQVGVTKLLSDANALAPVGGIFNLAVVLHDAILENQTIDQFVASSKGKAVATHHFDVLTRKMCPQLQQFVVFSSVSCGRGNPGQTNYGMSNSVMERICEARVRDGLPGLAVQWGAVGDVGLVADMQDDNRELVIGGTLQQTIGSCLEALDGFLKQSHPVVASMVVAEKVAGDGSGNLTECILGILGIHDIKKLSPSATLSELGMDSMNGVEVKQTLERDFEVFLTPIEIRDLTVMRLQELSQAKTEGTELETSEGSGLGDILNIDSYFQALLTKGVEYPYVVELPSKQKSASPVFLIPGWEGLAQSVAPLASGLDGRTYALQLYKHASKSSVRQVAEFLLELAKEKMVPGTPLQIVGFSFGGLYAMEMMAALEEEGYRGKLILIDTSPDYLKAAIGLMGAQGEEIFQVKFIMLHLEVWKIVPPGESNKWADECQKQGPWEKKLDWFLQKTSAHFDITDSHFRGLSDAIINRFTVLHNYRWEHKLKLASPVILLHPTSKILDVDYGLSQYFETVEAVHVIKGDHHSIIKEPSSAVHINEFLEKPLPAGSF